MSGRTVNQPARALRVWALWAAAVSVAAVWGSSAWITGQASGPVALIADLRHHIPPDVACEPDLEYGRAGGQALTLDLYRPVHPRSRHLPLVLHLHSGGWHTGDKIAHRDVWAWLAGRGYIVASANYRLAPQCRWPAQIEDAKAAVRWLRANASRFGGDPERIGAIGESSGGHLVALIATTDDRLWNDSGGNQGVSARIQAAIAQYAPLDLTAFSPSYLPLRIDLAWLFGAPYGQPRDQYLLDSPVTHAVDATAPFLLVHGEMDTLVPLDQSERMERALQKAGKPVEFLRVANAEHNLVPVRGRVMRPSQGEVNRAIQAFLDRSIGNRTARPRPDSLRVPAGAAERNG
jgi:acetyl esterase/lipase